MSYILVVDDEAVIREPIAAALRLAGFRTAAAADGKAALAVAMRETPSLVLLDLAMPVMDGLTCLAALRAHATTADVPVILLTSAADGPLVARAARLRVKEYLLKSAFALPDLLKRVALHAADLAPRDTTSPAA